MNFNSIIKYVFIPSASVAEISTVAKLISIILKETTNQKKLATVLGLISHVAMTFMFLIPFMTYLLYRKITVNPSWSSDIFITFGLYVIVVFGGIYLSIRDIEDLTGKKLLSNKIKFPTLLLDISMLLSYFSMSTLAAFLAWLYTEIFVKQTHLKYTWSAV